MVCRWPQGAFGVWLYGIPTHPQHTIRAQFDTYTTEYSFGAFDETAASCPLPTSDDETCANAFVKTGPTAAIALQGSLLVECVGGAVLLLWVGV